MHNVLIYHAHTHTRTTETKTKTKNAKQQNRTKKPMRTESTRFWFDSDYSRLRVLFSSSSIHFWHSSSRSVRFFPKLWVRFIRFRGFGSVLISRQNAPLGGIATYRMPLRTLSAGEQSSASVHDRWRYGRLSMNQPESAMPRSLAPGARRDSRPLSRSMLRRTPVPPALQRTHATGHFSPAITDE